MSGEKFQLKEWLLKEGFEASSLDDLVHDAANIQATDANNGGLDAQLDFLLDTCGWSIENVQNNLKGES